MFLSSQFKHRLFVSTIGILALALTIYFSHTSHFELFFIFANAVIIAIALFEYYNLAIHKGFQPLMNEGILCGVLYVLSLYFGFNNPLWRPLPLLILLFSLFFLSILFFQKKTQPLANLAITSFGFLYIVLPLGCASQLNYWFSSQGIDGRIWLTYVIIVAKATDVGAYFTGKIIGKTPLASQISPKKTVEGAIGGTLLAILTSFFLSFAWKEMALTVNQSLWLGCLLAILAQMGDLIESNLKRDAGVKDSNYLPGLGGILDIVDSLVFPLPIVYLLLQMQAIGPSI